MIIADLMTPNPTTIRHDAMLHMALETMERVGGHHLPVVSLHGVLVGILTSHDCRQALNIPSISQRHWKNNKALERIPVDAVMTFVPTVVQEYISVEEAIDLMLEKHIGCLPVMRGRALVGIVTTTDILRAFSTILKQNSAAITHAVSS